jgi:hypothetical protein
MLTSLQDLGKKTAGTMAGSLKDRLEAARIWLVNTNLMQVW